MESAERRAAVRLWWALAAVVLSSVAFVALPVVLLHPFRPQTHWGVALAFELRQEAPRVTLVALLAALALAASIARRPGARRRLLPLGLLATLALGSAWFARQNHFEWMFRPIPAAAYAKAAEATFVEASDMVIAVELNGDAVAYPVRQMAYHHLLNDTVGGLPLVSTY